MKKYSALLFLPFLLLADVKDVIGYYSGYKEDATVLLKVYDDSTFSYTASREWPFEVSEGNWDLRGDTLVLNSTPCKNPEALTHAPVRTYLTFTGAKYFYKKNTLTPVNDKNKLIRDQILTKEK